jgi:hypothetical protein
MMMTNRCFLMVILSILLSWTVFVQAPSAEIKPLPSALHVLPPVGNDSGNVSTLDKTLKEFLKISVCEVTRQGTCTSFTTFTSRSGTATSNRIRFLKDRYQVDWKLPFSRSYPRNQYGRKFELRFTVADLGLGSATYEVRILRAVLQIKFRIDNHPVIRARVLHRQGYTATEIAEVLRAEFSLSGQETAQILRDEGYGVLEIAQALRDAYFASAQEAAQILKNIGYSSVEVGLALRDVFAKDAQAAAQILKDIGYSVTEVGLALRDVFARSAREAAQIIKDIGYSEDEIVLVLIELYDTYLAIVDVMVSDWDSCANVPSDYTGLAWGQTVTVPYIPGLIGTRVWSNDVNKGIGGTDTTIWVKYDLVPVTSDQPVLVDYGVFHWPYWNPWCPSGWERANGTSSGMQGALTTGTWGDCWRIGLCVHYVPMSQTDTFMTNAGLSYTGGSEAACPVLGEANLGYWPMQADSLDIHRDCGDGNFMYLCYGRGKAWPPMPTSIDVTDEEKLNLLATYAPRVWIASGESYWPSSVEWAFPYLERYVPCADYPSGCFDFWEIPSDPFGHRGACAPSFPLPPPPLCEPCKSGDLSACRLLCQQYPEECNLESDYLKYWLQTWEGLGSPSDVLPFFRGCNGYSTSNPCTINDAPVYAFWVKKSFQMGESLFDFVDLVYFFYYPYNRGKEVIDTIFGSHVGDWEHVTMRLMWAYDDQTGWSLQPVQMYISAHDFGGTYDWAAIPKINDTHPVVYSAWGSHGVWLTAGEHDYGEVCYVVACEDLTDWTSEGTAWDTWNNMAALDYNAKQGLGGSIWPLWMSNDFTNPGTCGNPSDPACGPIYRWGNMRRGEVFGYYRLEDGPTGPVSKGVWSPGILK